MPATVLQAAPFVLYFPACVVEIFDTSRCVRTTFLDGASVMAGLNRGQEEEDKARGMGYTGHGDDLLWAMTREHDFLHVFLAAYMSKPKGAPSRALRYEATAHQEHVSQEFYDREEDIVKAFARYMNDPRGAIENVQELNPLREWGDLPEIRLEALRLLRS